MAARAWGSDGLKPPGGLPAPPGGLPAPPERPDEFWAAWHVQKRAFQEVLALQLDVQERLLASLLLEPQRSCTLSDASSIENAAEGPAQKSTLSPACSAVAGGVGLVVSSASTSPTLQGEDAPCLGSGMVRTQSHNSDTEGRIGSKPLPTRKHSFKGLCAVVPAGLNDAPLTRPALTAAGTVSRLHTGKGVEELDDTPWIHQQLARIIAHFNLQKVLRFLVWLQELEEPPRNGKVNKVISSHYFELTTALVIMVNSVFTAFVVDYEVTHVDGKLPKEMMVIEFVFIMYYTMEIGFKIFVHRVYFLFGPESTWNIFDLSVLTVAIFDQITTHMVSMDGTNVTFARSFRLFKLGKILRMFRLVHCLRELRMMMESILGSFMSLFWSFVMIGLILYIFSLLFVQGASGALGNEDISAHEKAKIWDSFSSVGRSVLTLYMTTTGGVDWREVYEATVKLGWLYSGMFIFYIAFWNFAVMNILTGIFVDHAMALASPDRDQQILEQRRKDVTDGLELKRLVTEMDEDKLGTISKSTFAMRVENQNLVRYLAMLGFEVKDVDTFFDTLTMGNGDDEIPIDDFVTYCMRMKGTASSIDVQGLAFQLKFMRSQLTMLTRRERELFAMSGVPTGVVPQPPVVSPPVQLNQQPPGGSVTTTRASPTSPAMLQAPKDKGTLPGTVEGLD